MTKRMSGEKYFSKLESKKITSIPIEEPISYSTKILHLCSCGEVFERSPAHMLGKTATGACDTCHKEIKRKNKLKTPDNGYLDYCVSHNFSVPVNISDYRDRHTKIDHCCTKCGEIWSKAPGKAYRKSYFGVCPKCTTEIKSLKRRNSEDKFLKELDQKKLMCFI